MPLVFQFAVPFKGFFPLHFPPQHNEPQNLHWSSQWTSPTRTTSPTLYQVFFNDTCHSIKPFTCYCLSTQVVHSYLMACLLNALDLMVEKYDYH